MNRTIVLLAAACLALPVLAGAAGGGTYRTMQKDHPDVPVNKPAAACPAGH